MIDPLFALTIAIALSGLFAGSAVHQIRAWSEWPSVVGNYRLLPDALVPFASVAVTAGELAIGIALPWSAPRTIAALGAVALLVAFAIAIAVNVRRGRTQIDCGCFGSRLSQGISTWMVGRNLLLAALAALLLLPSSPRPVASWEPFAAAACALTAALLYPVFAIATRRAPPTFDEIHSARNGPQRIVAGALR